MSAPANEEKTSDGVKNHRRKLKTMELAGITREVPTIWKLTTCCSILKGVIQTIPRETLHNSFFCVLEDRPA